MPVTGFTNGCFDLLHEGHKHLLSEARKQCDRLIVAINSDESVRRLKGSERPIWNESRRIGAMCQFGCEYPFIVGDEDHLRHTIRTLRPDVIFKGSDYEGKDVVGSDLARVVLIPLLPGYSTTNEIEKRHGLRDRQ